VLYLLWRGNHPELEYRGGNWNAVQATNWQGCQDGKQAEFLLENNFPWHLVERIGVINANVYTQVMHTMTGAAHTSVVEVKRDWYY